MLSLSALLGPPTVVGIVDWDADVGWGGAIGKFHTCGVSPDTHSLHETYAYEMRLQQSSYNQSVFGRTSNLYVADRCFVPRRICKLRLKSSPSLPRGAELLLPREGPGQTHLMAGSYDVVLGAAQVVGVLTRNSFAAQLERHGGLPVVNLGRGAAGPHIYTDASSWPALAPLLTNARAVIICVMAGRSSPSSESGAFSGNSFGAEQIRAYDRVIALERGGHRQHAERLQQESLRNARQDYKELVRRIRSNSAVPGATVPRVLLVWFSGCPISGCKETWQYPQYFTSERSVQAIQRAMAVELVDASYGHLPPSPPIPIDQCASCVPTGSGLCNSVVARQDGGNVGKLCGGYCGKVSDWYYPDDNAHTHAARLLRKILAEPDLSVSDLAAEGEPPPIRLDGGGRLFFHHVHKASGTSFLAYLSALEGLSDCAAFGITSSDHVAPTPWTAFSRWWHEPRLELPGGSCNLASLETPELGEMLAKLGVGKTAAASDTALDVAAAGTPQMLSFFRHPVSRCRSHWRYEQALCRRSPLDGHTSFCRDYFLPKFGLAEKMNDTSAHAAFVAEHCTEHVTRSLVVANGVPSARLLFTRRFAFFGMQEHFLESVCLFLWQAGRFRRDVCTCPPGEHAPLRIEQELLPPDAKEAALLRAGSVGVPPLMLSDAELAARSPRDVVLYDTLLRVFRQRVRNMESRVNATVWGCASARVT